MRNTILGAASALALVSPAIAADLPVAPYSQAPTVQRETHTYEYQIAPPVVVEEPAPAVVVTACCGAPVVVEDYPFYAAPRVFVTR